MPEILMRQALKDAVDEVLEKMFFADTSGEAADAGDSVESELAAELSFDGEPSGTLQLRVTAAAAHQIAADFLGIEPAEISAAQVCEVVRELANMICGSVLSRVESAAAFRLGAPRIVIAAAGFAELPSMTAYSVQLSNGRLTVKVGTGIPACPQSIQSAS